MGLCRLCQSDDIRPRHQIGSVRVEECAACRLVQVANQPSPEDLERLYSDSYFDHGKYSDAFAQRKENSQRLSLLRNNGVARGAKVLDAGCATGDFIHFAGDEYDFWGLDISAAAVEQAKELNPRFAGQIRQGVLEEQDYPDGFFDAIALWDVLEHLWEPVSACERLVKWLKPGGLFCISTPNIGSLTARLMGRRWAFMTVPEHLVFFRRSSLNMLLHDRLGMDVARWMTRGKWANVGFLFYKLKRMFPSLVPQLMVNLFRGPVLRRLVIFVPTGDIQYAAARRRLEGKQEDHD